MATEPTDAMIAAGMPWLINWRHMRKSDQRNALASAYKDMAALAPAPAPKPRLHSLSACKGCGVAGDDFSHANVEAFEVTGELYCDDCADGALEAAAEAAADG